MDTKWILFWVIPISLYSQSVSILNEYELHQEISETSGLITLNNGHSFWTMNDGGHPPYLYELDSTGHIIRRVFISNALNIDWEDLSTDYNDHFYIADTGNNTRKRKSIQIYRGAIEDLLTKDTLEVQQIQIKLNPDEVKKKQLQYPDIEAFCCHNGSGYLFTKNKKKLFQGVTDYHILHLGSDWDSLDSGISLSYGQRFQLEFQITGCCYSKFEKAMYWITPTELISWNGDRLQPIYKRYPFPYISQKEAICTVDKNKWACTQEANRLLKQPAKLIIFAINP